MKYKQHLTAALLTALAMPALARDTQPAEQAPVEPAIEAADAKAPGDGQAQGRIVLQGDAPGQVVMRINGEEIEFNGQGGAFEFEVPNIIVGEAAAVPKQIEATFLGVATQPMTAKDAKELGLKKPTGLMLSFIQEDSPAAQAGLKKNDGLLKLNDQVLINAEQLVVLIRSFEPGEKVTLHGVREGEPFNTEVTLSKAMVAPVGPGGAALDQPGWRVQQNGAFGPKGGAMILPGNLDQLPPLEGGHAGLEDLIRNLQQDQDQNMQQLLQRLDLNLEDMIGGANGGGAMQSQVMKNDGQHSISLKTGKDGRHLTIKNKAGEVLYDGRLPAEDVKKHLIEDNGLPLEVFKKVQPMLNGNGIKFDLKIDGQPVPEQAPEEQALPDRV